MLKLNLQKLVEKWHMSKRQSVSAVLNAEPQLDWFWTFFPFFWNFITRHLQKKNEACKIIWTPTTKEPKFLMLWPQLVRSISNCVIVKIENHCTKKIRLGYLLSAFWIFTSLSGVSLSVCFQEIVTSWKKHS